MNVLGNHVLLREVLTKKVQAIILPGQTEDNKEYYESRKTVQEVGPDASGKGISEGDIPVLASYAEPVAIKVISGKAGDNEIIRELIYVRDYIVAIDNSEQL